MDQRKKKKTKYLYGKKQEQALDKKLKSKGVHLTCSLNNDLKPLVDREI